MSDQRQRPKQYRDASNLNARAALHERFSTNPRGWHRWVFDRLLRARTSRVLEVGAGAGALWRENAERVPGEWQVTVTDLSEGMLRDAAAALDADGRRLHKAVADALSLPFPDEHFDVVIANHMLYHVPDICKALWELRRVLRPGGRLFAATNGRRHMRELKEWVSRFDARFFVASSQENAGFSLETGGEQLLLWFDDIRLERYEDGLVVTEVEPLIAYVLSTADEDLIADEAIERCREFFSDMHREQGAIRITKDTGLFIAEVGS